MAKYSFDSIIFDLDGVVTKTASIHAKAWKTVFDEYLRMREKRDGEPFREFTHDEGYLPYVDGKPRYQGVKSFLESRGINIPFGDPSDSADKETVCGIGNKKNSLFRDFLKRDGAEVFSTTIDFIKKLKKAGVKIGVASSSKSCKDILESVRLENIFETRVDGVVSVELGLKGKPEGDIFVVAARNMGKEPADSVIVEDATSGVEAGRNGGFGLVLGVARKNNESELLEKGADVVVRDLSEISVEWIDKWFKRKPRPLFHSWETTDRFPFEPDPKSKGSNVIVNPSYGRTSKDALFSGKRLVFFLDYDGTLTPIVERPELAVISKEMKNAVDQLSKLHTVAIVSGRMRDEVEKLVGIDGIFYAGGHGFDIKGPQFSRVQPEAKETMPIMAGVTKRLSKELKSIKGALIEDKKFSVAVHYRPVKEEQHIPKIESLVNDIVKNNQSLRLMSGKKVFEILPNIHWDKGQAIRWIMEALKISWEEATVIYIGDDVTDEYAFRAIRTRGTGILVSDKSRISMADFQLSSTDEVRELFKKVIGLSS